MLFDRIAVLDWSASSTPKLGADSIWLAVCESDVCSVQNFSTRHEALRALGELPQPGSRTLLGVDFSLGYPRGTAAALGLVGLAWSGTWKELGGAIRDDDRNANNRFGVAAQFNRRFAGAAGPFWGCPPSQASMELTPTKPDRLSEWPPTWRHVEEQLRNDGHRPFSSWQLLGAGSVGSQSLMGIAALERLRWNLGREMVIWPFTTGLQAPTGMEQLVVSEVWPSFWPVEVPDGVVKDAAQVDSTARLLARQDECGALASLFSPDVDESLVGDVVDEEGWVLGVDGAHG